MKVREEEEEIKDRLFHWSSLLPGLGQGLTRAAISHPFEVIKVRTQTAPHLTSWQHFVEIAKRSPQLFVRGLPISMAGTGAERAMSFAIFERVLDTKTQSPYVAALVAAVPSSAIAVPVMSITSNLVTTHTHGSQLEYARSTLQTKGLGFFFRAYPWEVARSSLSGTIYMGTYGKCRSVIGCDTKGKIALAAVTAGWSVWLVQYPYDAIKTVYQTTHDDTFKKNGNGIVQTARRRIRSHGFTSLYSGIGVVLVRTVPSAVVGMWVYEAIRAHRARGE